MGLVPVTFFIVLPFTQVIVICFAVDFFATVDGVASFATADGVVPWEVAAPLVGFASTAIAWLNFTRMVGEEKVKFFALR